MSNPSYSSIWEERQQGDGSLEILSRAVIPWHLGQQLAAAWAALQIGLQPRFHDGKLALGIPPQSVRWYRVDEPQPMTWPNFVRCLTWLVNSTQQTRTAHAGLDPYTFGSDGFLRRHYFAYVEAASRADANEYPHGLLVGDPRFSAPELWAGDTPTLESDLFAAAAIFCFKRRPLACLCTPPIVVDSVLTIPPRERIPPDLPGDQASLLLSLLDVDPHVRAATIGAVLQSRSER